MGRRRGPNEATPHVPLAYPDRSAPLINRETLLDLAEKRGLLAQQKQKVTSMSEYTYGEEDVDNTEETAIVGRFADAFLWSISLMMVHFTLEFIVQHQYAVEISWPEIISKTAKAFPGMAHRPTNLIRPAVQGQH